MAEKRRLDLSLASRVLEPGPLVLITSMHRAQHNVMTAGWLMPIGFDPPRLAVAIHPSRLTHQLITRSETFGLSLPMLDLLNQVHRCGVESGRDLDKFDKLGLRPMEPYEIEAPHVEQCVAHLECGLIARQTLADHDLFVGEILALAADPDLFDDRWRTDQEIDLIHHIAAEEYVGLGKSYRARIETDEEG